MWNGSRSEFDEAVQVGGSTTVHQWFTNSLPMVQQWLDSGDFRLQKVIIIFVTE